MKYPQHLLQLSATALLLAMPSSMVIAEPSVKGLPPESEWLPGIIKRDEHGRLYLATPGGETKTAKKTTSTKTTQPIVSNTKALHKNSKTKTLHKNSVTLSWSAPSSNVDGSAIEGLLGYKIYYWTDKDSHKKIHDVKNVLEYKLDKLNYGETYFFAITSYNSKNIEGPFSEIVSVILEKSTTPPPSQ